jgi:hypothetical protein
MILGGSRRRAAPDRPEGHRLRTEGRTARQNAAVRHDGAHATLVLTAHPGRADIARRVPLAEAGLRERNDLQGWIRAHPDILGPGVEHDLAAGGTG